MVLKGRGFSRAAHGGTAALGVDVLFRTRKLLAQSPNLSRNTRRVSCKISSEINKKLRC